MRAIRLYRYLLATCAALLMVGHVRLLYGTFSNIAAPDTRLALGVSAPDFALASTQSHNTVSLAGWRGRVVYLVFMATECSISAAEMPVLEQWAAAHPAVAVLAVGRASLPELAAYAGTQYPHITFLADFDGRVWNAYGAQSTPTAYIIDAAGWIRYSRIGGPSRLDQFDLQVQFVNTDWETQ